MAHHAVEGIDPLVGLVILPIGSDFGSGAVIDEVLGVELKEIPHFVCPGHCPHSNWLAEEPFFGEAVRYALCAQFRAGARVDGYVFKVRAILARLEVARLVFVADFPAPFKVAFSPGVCAIGDAQVDPGGEVAVIYVRAFKKEGIQRVG